MTVINNIEIDNIHLERNEIKEAILNNQPIEEKLNVIIVVSNPCTYAKRYLLANQFKKRMEFEENVNLYVVELTYGNQKYYVTDNNNKNHLRLNCEVPLWHKENMINIGIKRLLPKNWKAVAWIDADVEFESVTWALDTLKILNGCKDIVQLYSHSLDMNKHKLTMSVFNSFGYQYTKKNQYTSKGLNYWHPGFAWACTRKAYEKMEGLYDKSILGSGDNNMALSLISRGVQSININTTDNYKDSILQFQNRVKNLRIGYVPGVIRHHFHGEKKNRKYSERWMILVNHKYDPYNHVEVNNDGLIVPTETFPEQLKNDILKYFKERNEDE
jgi:hypothetical protein